jgi:hypothetical protein
MTTTLQPDPEFENSEWRLNAIYLNAFFGVTVRFLAAMIGIYSERESQSLSI